MAIVFGTDFTEHANQAAEGAAALAAALKEPLELVHVLNEFGARTTIAADEAVVFEPVRKRMNAQAERLQQLGAVVHPHLVAGDVPGVLNGVALRSDARLVVIASRRLRGLLTPLLSILRTSLLQPRAEVVELCKRMREFGVAAEGADEATA